MSFTQTFKAAAISLLFATLTACGSNGTPSAITPDLNVDSTIASVDAETAGDVGFETADPESFGIGSSDPVALSTTGSTKIRVMAANITSGNNQSYDPGHGTRIFQGLKPDVVLIQEFNYGSNSSTDIRNYVNQAFGSNFYYYREGGAQIPNGVISRWPIIASGEWDDTSVSNRDFAWARIDIPGSRDLWAVSVHLLTSSSSARNTEAAQLTNLIKSQIPAGDYLIVGGDFNTSSASESAISTFSQVVNTSGPHPASQDGKTGTNASRSKQYDWVLVDNDLKQYQVPVTVGSASFTNGLVFDSRVFSPLSAVAPVQSGDSGSTNMQHMAVIKDFNVPGTGGTTPTPTPTATPAPTPTPVPTSTPGGSTQTLLNTSSTVNSGSWKNYKINVPVGAKSVSIVMTGTGDADLYVRYGSSYPTLSTYDFRPYLDGTNETVTISSTTSPQLKSGQYYVSVNGYASTSSFTIKATASF